MLFLLGSIILTSFLTLWFKVIAKWNISIFQTIVFNYITAVITGSIVEGGFPVNRETMAMPWFPWAVAMGLVFIMLFNLIAFTAQRIGVAVTSVANKLSLVIPFIFSIYLYDEVAGYLKFSGVALALAGVILTTWPSTKQEAGPQGPPLPRTLGFILIDILFIGSGLLDTMIKYVENYYLDVSSQDDYLVTTFFSAAALGSLALIYLFVSGKQKPDRRAIWSGIALGIPNYFSIWCLLQVLRDYRGNSSAIIPINNMGIVLFSAVVAWWLFREKLSLMNWIGIIISLGAIALIAYG